MLRRLQEHFARPPLPGLAAVYLFGSHTTGRAHSESDVDLAILLDPEAHPTPAGRFAARLATIAHLGDRLGAPVDVVVLNDVPPLLGRAIVTEGTPVVIYDAYLNHAYRRDIQLRAADLEPFIERHRRTLLAGLSG